MRKNKFRTLLVLLAFMTFTESVFAQMGCIHCVLTQAGLYRCQSSGGDPTEGWCFCDTSWGQCEVDYPCWIDQNGRNCFFPETALTKEIKRPKIDDSVIREVAAKSPRLAMALVALNRHTELPINHTRIFIVPKPITSEVVETAILHPSEVVRFDSAAIGGQRESAFEVTMERTGPFTGELRLKAVAGSAEELSRTLEIDLLGSASFVVAKRNAASWRITENTMTVAIASFRAAQSDSWKTLDTSY